MSYRLQQEWLSDPKFFCWISGVPGDEFVYCRLCKKDVNLYSGRSSLVSHGKGVKHSNLEKAFKRQMKKRSRVASSPRSSAPAKRSCHQSHGSQTAGVNINFCSPSTSTAPDIHQQVSAILHQRQQLRSASSNHYSASSNRYSASSNNIHPSSSVQPPRDFIGVRRPPSPSVTSTSNSHVLFDAGFASYRVKEEFKLTINQMCDQHSSIIQNDISDILNMYRDSLSSCHFSRIRGILEDYRISEENLRERIREEFFSYLR